MAQDWETLVFNEILNIGIIISHFSAFIDELLFQLIEEFWCLSSSLTLHTSLSLELSSDLSLLSLVDLSWDDVVSFHIL